MRYVEYRTWKTWNPILHIMLQIINPWSHFRILWVFWRWGDLFPLKILLYEPICFANKWHQISISNRNFFFSEMWIFKNFISERNQKALWSITQKWVCMQAHAYNHRRPKAKFWYAVCQKYTVPSQLRLAHFLLNNCNWSALISRTFFRMVVQNSKCHGTWGAGNLGHMQ